MVQKSQTDLFTLDINDQTREWGGLVREIHKFHPSLLELWISSYDSWKYLYKRFRDYEQSSFFKTDSEGKAVAINDEILQAHRHVIFALLNSGQECLELLNALQLDDKQAQERLTWARRVECLLESLREGLELWHPVNSERIIDTILLEKIA